MTLKEKYLKIQHDMKFTGTISIPLVEPVGHIKCKIKKHSIKRQVPWNKGLTKETDARVAKNAEAKRKKKN